MIVPAKISRPRLTAVYQRARLLDLLESTRAQHAATFVSGPPGAGKSTLVSSYIEFRNLRCIWYQVDAGDDDDAATFFHFFSRAAQHHFPKDSPPLPRFGNLQPCELLAFTRTYFRHLYDVLETPFVLVLDNYQELPDDSRLHQVVRTACEEMPQAGHIVILSRSCCPKKFARLQLGRTLALIDAGALDLTLEETLGVAALRGVVPASTAAAAALHAQAGGWMAGLMLLLEQNGAAHPALFARHAPNDILFDYFEGEVFGPLDDDSRDFLLQSALLPSMTLASVSRLTGSPAAATLLRELARKNLFITRHGADASTYQFHPLFRHFLLAQGRTRYPAHEHAALCTRAAEALIAAGEHDVAVELLAQAYDWQGMAKVILATARALYEQGRLATLAIQIQRLPSDLISSTPWLLYWKGICHSGTSLELAQPALQQVYRLFAEAGEVDGMAASWSELINAICTMARDFHQLDAWIAEFDAQLAERFALMAPHLQVRVTISMFMALSYRRPLRPDLKLWLERTRILIDSEQHATNRPFLRQQLVTHYVLRGQLAEAELVLGLFSDAAHPSPATAAGAILSEQASEAMFALHAGLDQRCLQAASAGLLAAKNCAARAQAAALLCHGALMSLNRGDLMRADEFLAAFEQLAGSAQAGFFGAYYSAAAWRKFYGGEMTLATQLCGRANAHVQAQGIPFFIAACDLGAGILLHLCGNTEQALAHLEAGRQTGRDIQNSVIEYVYQLFAAYIAFDMGNAEQGRAHLAAGMRLGSQQGYMHFLFFPPAVIAQLCCRALEAGIEKNYVCALIERNKFQPSPSWRQIESWPWPLRIYTLGRFSVVRSGVPIKFSGKSQKKPLELLRALIALGGREVPETRLADVLWPDAEGDAAAQTLATTLFRLRKLIGEHVIRRQDNRLTLEPSLCWVDCWAFERLSASGQIDQATLAKLGKLYQGPFLAGEESASWIVPMRERLRIRFDRITRLQGSQREGIAAAA